MTPHEAPPDEASNQERSAPRRPEVDPRAAALLPAADALRLGVIPFAFNGARVRLGMRDPDDAGSSDQASVLLARPVERVGLDAVAFNEMVRAAYGTTAAQLAARLGGDAGPDEVLANLEAIDAGDLHRMAEQPTLINLVNLIILEAIRARASDIHVEPFEKVLRVKYRVDGVLIDQDAPPKHLQPAITSRIKIMGGMNIAERYAPQDGHITLRFEGRKIDIRVSTVPTIYGESVVMRILDKEAIRLDLATLGMREADRDRLGRLLELPHGMVLVTGPTGSGKTTTLYACLSKVYDPTKKIITIEDPVEYELTGINQIPVNPKRGLTFANGLRSILRQDPDVIMVGEIRDNETADIAVRAALTGHLIFSTLHTNNAVSAIGRLLDMEIEPFLLASVLEAVAAQRLGRRICEPCRRRTTISEVVRPRLTPAELAMFDRGEGFEGAGCEACGGTGYKGRLGYYELVVVSGAMREAIASKPGLHALIKTLPPGFATMRRDGIIKAAAGLTTIAEVLRATQDSDEGEA